MKRLISVILTLTMLLSLFSVVPVQAASSSYCDWKQYSGYWKSYKLGGSSYTMKSIGCTTTALAMAAVKLGCESENSFDPGIFLTRMNNASGYNGYGAIYWSKINKAVPNMSMVGSEIKFSTESNSTRIAKISENLNKGYAVLITILRYTDADGDKHWHYVLADSVNNGVLNILDPGGANGNITNKYGSAEIMIRSIRVFKNNGKTKHETEVVIPPQTHTCSYSVSTESSHPHNKYNVCSCGKKVYLGKNTLSSCSSCYPVGNVNLTRSFEKTKGSATFYRNNVSNATSYTLKLYHNGSFYDQYTMPSDEKTIAGLPSGNYSATLYAKNSNTGEERSDSCKSFKIIETYTVSYNANGGSNAPSSHEKMQDDNDFTLKLQIPTKSHHVFKGWARSKNATIAEYQPGDTYERNVKITLYAVWEPEAYIIKFDANGGKGEITDTTITYGDTIRIPNNIVKDGYYLKGWSTSKTATSATYKIGMDYSFDANTTLYAVWGSSTWGGAVASSFAGGDGTKGNPYQISNAGELALLAKKVNSQTAKPTSKTYYILTNNIDLVYTEWVPIGLADTSYQIFYDDFDGNDYTISGIYISSGEYEYYGLFGYSSDANIKNLTITGDFEGLNFYDKNVYMGGLLGYGNSTNISNVNCCYFDISNITASNSNTGVSKAIYIGNLIGSAKYGGSITNCTSVNSSISIENKSVIGYLGGIVGSASVTISNCSIQNDNVLFGRLMTTRSLWLGGIVGGGSSYVNNCFVTADRFTYQQTVDGAVFAGGICGNAQSVKNSSVKFENKDKITFNNQQIPYSIYIIATDKNGFGIGSLGGISAVDASIDNCKYDGCSLIMISNTGRIWDFPSVGGLCGGAMESKSISNSISNVDGIIYCSGPGQFVFAGGSVGCPLGSGSKIQLSNILAIADSVTAINTEGTELASSGGYYLGGFAGDIAGFSYAADDIDSDGIYTNDRLTVRGTSLTTYIATTKSNEKIKTRAFQKNLLGLGEYTTLYNLKTDSEAVWVLKDGDLPELYYNCLNDITISDDIENGSVTIDKLQAVDGEIVTVTATPNDGYVLNKIYVDGIEQDGTTFVVDGNDEVYVTFAEKIPVFDVMVTSGENVSASLVNADAVAPMLASVMSLTTNNDSALTANDGEEIQVNAVADSDYTVDSIYVNGEEVSGNSFILTEDSVVTMDVTSISTDVIATTNDAEDVGSHFALVGGSVSGEDENTVKYIRYWSADDVDTVYVTEVESGSGNYTVELMDLEPETTYYYQMTEYGEIKSFITEEEIIPILDESEIEEDEGGGDTLQSSLTTTTYKTLTSTYKFSIECSQALTTEFLAIACYDSEGELLILKQIECDGDVSYTGSVPIDANIDYVKIFVWSSPGSLKPLAGVEVVDIMN